MISTQGLYMEHTAQSADLQQPWHEVLLLKDGCCEGVRIGRSHRCGGVQLGGHHGHQQVQQLPVQQVGCCTATVLRQLRQYAWDACMSVCLAFCKEYKCR